MVSSPTIETFRPAALAVCLAGRPF